MANLIMITGPQAVGKMTVAEDLGKRIGYNVFTNHDSIELSLKIFENNLQSQQDLSRLIRDITFFTACKNNINIIFTFITDYDNPKDIDYVNELRKQFEIFGGNFYYVELFSSMDTRLKRNITPHRLELKPSKRDIDWSNNELIESAKVCRFNSNNNEFICPNHIKINNNSLLPSEVSEIIINSYNFKTLDNLRTNCR